MNTLDAIKARKSVRCYNRNTVEAEKIMQLLKAANSAPNVIALNISVVENKDILESLNQETLNAMKKSGNDFLVKRASLEDYQPLYGAPVMFLFSASKEALFAEASASCAATSLTIAATELDLGSCYIITPRLGIKAKLELRNQIGIPEGFALICAVLVGYSDGNAFESARKTSNIINYRK